MVGTSMKNRILEFPWMPWTASKFPAAPGDTRRRDPVGRASAGSARCRSLRAGAPRSPETGRWGESPWDHPRGDEIVMGLEWDMNLDEYGI